MGKEIFSANFDLSFEIHTAQCSTDTSNLIFSAMYMILTCHNNFYYEKAYKERVIHTAAREFRFTYKKASGLPEIYFKVPDENSDKEKDFYSIAHSQKLKMNYMNISVMFFRNSSICKPQ
jgi:hypothetical protein